nr:c-type cytochrome [uncultured Martelella sp.]
MKRITIGVLIVAALFMGAAFVVALTPPKLDPDDLRNIAGANVQNGEKVFWASGCAGCHAAPGATGDDRLVLAGGLGLDSHYGTFHAPNISPDKEHGIGDWSFYEFANAMKKGIGRHGENLYPSLPYTSYVRMNNQDIRDLHAFLMTLPESSAPSKPHDITFPFNIRLSVSFWKLLYFDSESPAQLENAAPDVLRGQYLVEGPAHCGECHTPRNLFGGLKYDHWLEGGPNPEGGDGIVPDITPGSADIGDWTASEIADYLETGFTPDYDTVGGSMVEVQKNISHLSRADLEAIGAYLKAIPAN